MQWDDPFIWNDTVIRDALYSGDKTKHPPDPYFGVTDQVSRKSSLVPFTVSLDALWVFVTRFVTFDRILKHSRV